MKEFQDNSKAAEGSQNSSLLELTTQPQGSMESLVVWNLSKALERNRALNFQEAINDLQNKMEQSSSRELSRSVFAQPQERHLACALLAWKQLHRGSDSLIRFAELNRERLLSATDEDVKSEAVIPESSDEFDTASILQKQSFLMGPVVTLPVHTKVVMRVEKTTTNNKTVKPTSTSQNVLKKLEAAGGCVELGCVAKLKELDRGTSELRARASKLSKREAERAELLERAEMAWRELEVGFQRRLRLADEKEEQLATRIETLIEERKEHKQTCVNLIAKVKEKADALEKRKQTMQKCEEEVCGLACLCHQLNEEVLAVDTALAEASSKYHKLDRECQFKEEKAQRRVNTLKSQLESAQQFTVEAELAMRAELGALKDQLEHVSGQLLKKDEKNERLRGEIKELNTVKMTLVEDLEECNRACDLGLQGKLAELKQKKAELAYTRENALKCTCHVPVETSVEAKRTPSLAALCCCAPGRLQSEDECSCTSLRTKLLTDLLVELFAGLRFELGDTLNSLPCQMLKCLEDEHNWDMASALKTNLQNFFSKLLVGELDIAISTSIERYHAKWVGGTCADSPGTQGGGGGGGTGARLSSEKSAADCGCWGSGMKERIEELTRQMIDKRVKDLNLKGTSREESSLDTYTRSITDPSYKSSYESNNKVSRGSRGSDERDPSVLYCHVPHQRKCNKEGDVLPAFLKRTHNDVTQLRAQIEDLKKETIKKTDLKTMEENIVKLLQNFARPDPTKIYTNCPTKEDFKEIGSPKLKSSKNVSLESTIKVHNYRNVHIENTPRNFIDMNKNMLNYKKRPIKDFSPPNRFSKLSVYGSGQLNKLPQKVFKKYTPSYAVNVCLCQDTKDLPGTSVVRQDSFEVRNINMANSQPQWAQILSQDVDTNQETFKDDLETALQFEMELLKEKELSSTKKEIPRHENSLEHVDASKPACLTDCICLNKMPSTSSVEQLLDVLNKWKKDLYTTTEVVDKNYSEISQTKAIILENSEPYLNSNKISLNSLKKNSLHSSYKASSHSTNRLQNSKNSSSVHSANKAMTQNVFRGNLPLVNKAVNSPTRLSTNVMDMKEIPEIPELDSQSKKSHYKGPDSLDDSNKELSFIVSNSQLTLGKESNSNKEDLKKKIMSSDSECLGQTNLNKSIKGLCKCSESYESRCKCADGYEDKTKLQYQNPSRGTEAYACDFKEDIVESNVKSNISGSQSDVKTLPYFNGDKSQHSFYSPLSVVNESNGEPKNSSSYKTRNKSNENDGSFKEPSKNSVELSCDYDYSVKFLGVTLNNTNEEPESEASLLKDIHKYEVEKKFKSKIVSNKKSTTSIPKSNLYTSCRKSIDPVASCQCYDKFEDMKLYFNELLTNFKTIVTNQDKSLDAQSFKDITNYKTISNEFGVCSDENNSSHDLEVNTFELIKDHLKSKLQELKFSSCEFTCVPYEEEEKLLTAILLKIKQVISESTKHTCKCSDMSKTKGSWNRAYTLLQEYLKAKLKRVQCVCGSPTSLEENVLLPDVLDKVCHLIENDFDRLKNICWTNDAEKMRYEIPIKEKNYNKNSSRNITVNRVDVINTILPDLDKTKKVSKEVSKLSIMQNHKQTSKQSFLKNHKEISRQSFLKTENISSQVSKTFGEGNMFHIGSSCLNIDKNNIDEKEVNIDQIKPKQTCYLEAKPLESTKLSCSASFISSYRISNKKALEENTKSDGTVSVEKYLNLKPNFSDCNCATTICSHLSAQNEGERIVNTSLHTSNLQNFADFKCNNNQAVVTPLSEKNWLQHTDLPIPNRDNGPRKGAVSPSRDSCFKHYHHSLAGLTSRFKKNYNDTLFHPVDYPVFQEKVENAKSEMFQSPEKTRPICDCSLIPLCHVKMLVENIEDKLANSKCICDSFSSNVCPIHSKDHK